MALVAHSIQPTAAREAIAALSRGQPPNDAAALGYLSVGYEPFLKLFRDENLEQILAEGGSFVRFLSAGYGEGKTHFLRLLRACALEAGCAVSTVEVQGVSHPLTHVLTLYQMCINRLQVPGAADEGLEESLQILVNQTVGGDLQELKSLREKIRETEDKRKAPRSLAKALSIIVGDLTHGSSDDDLYSALVSYIKGRAVPRVSMSGNLLRSYSKIGPVRQSGKNALQFLSGFATLLQPLGIRGWLILIDEVDPPQAIRQTPAIMKCLATLRHMTDVAANSWLPSIGLCYAVPPDQLDRWSYQYRALASRIVRPSEFDSRPNPRATTCKIEDVNVLGSNQKRHEYFAAITTRIQELAKLGGYTPNQNIIDSLAKIVNEEAARYDVEATRRLVRRVSETLSRRLP